MKKLKSIAAAPAKAFFQKFDFIKFLSSISLREPGATYMNSRSSTPPEFQDQHDIARLAVDLTARAMAEKGDNVSVQELKSQMDIISCRYDADLHKMLRGASFNIINHLFQSRDASQIFTSADLRELDNLATLKKARQEGRGVVYLVNHSSHWDEFIFNVFLDQNGLGLPLFAAGQNMMATPTLTRIFMVGSYVIVRAGASRNYLSSLFHYCQALGELGKQQGIFLEAWSGGARTRDGSLRYPRRLVALQGALAARNDVLVQPVVISYSRVPEDLGLSEGRGLGSWLNGHHMLRDVLRRPWSPKESMIQGLKNIYGRTYVGFGRGRLVSELKDEMEHENANELTIDEFASLYAIKEIARDKKIMSSHLVAKAFSMAKSMSDMEDALARSIEEAREYHQRTFNQEPDFEDFVRESSNQEILADGLQSLRVRKVVGRTPVFSNRKPRLLSPHGLSYYATHGDRRLYSPSAKENFVVCGLGSWAFSIVSYLGRRTLSDKKYNNSSLTLYDSNSDAIGSLAYERTTDDPLLSEFRLPKNVFPTHDHTAAFRKATEVVVACAPQKIDEVLKTVFSEAHELRSLIIASRGFDPQSHRLTMQIAWEAAVSAGRSKVNILALNGPFTPVSLFDDDGGMWTLAGNVTPGRASEALLFKYGKFRVNISGDPIGVQMAAALADAYALYAAFLHKGKRISQTPMETAAFMREISAEVKSLAQALGGQAQTFESDNPAWLSEFIIRSLNCNVPTQSWVSSLKNENLLFGPLRTELLKQWPDPWSCGYFSIHSAYITAKHLGLNLPHLEEANRLFWS